MLKRTKYLVICVTLLLSGCFLAEPLPSDTLCDIKVNKEFIIHLSKKDLFEKRLSCGTSPSIDIETNLRDSMFYLYCDYEPRARFTFLAKVKSIGADSTSIHILQALALTTEGADDNKIERLKKTNPALLEDAFQKNFVDMLFQDNGYVLFQDNKSILDKEKKNGY